MRAHGLGQEYVAARAHVLWVSTAVVSSADIHFEEKKVHKTIKDAAKRNDIATCKVLTARIGQSAIGSGGSTAQDSKCTSCTLKASSTAAMSGTCTYASTECQEVSTSGGNASWVFAFACRLPQVLLLVCGACVALVLLAGAGEGDYQQPQSRFAPVCEQGTDDEHQQCAHGAAG